MTTTDDSVPQEVQEPEVEIDASGSYSTYLEYNKVLRTWLVAFGVGGPALFLVNGQIATRLADAHRLRLVVTLFLVGAGAQVLGAFLNKVANFYVHLSHNDPDVHGTRRHKFSEWLVNQFWLDIVIDVVTICVFGCAAWLLLTVFAADS
jgi:hypothetical protein